MPSKSLKETIIGNERVADVLEKSYKSGKLAHAYLFEGPEHMGKKTLALNFCRLILEDDRENICQNVDLMILGPNESEKQITIKEIRDLENSLSLYPYSSKYKIAIIEQAEKMNKAAANALLKTLEEPSKTTILILLTSNSKNMLDTIKSRCQILKFLPVKKESLEKFLKDKISDKSETERIIEISGYKPGKVIEFANDRKKIAELMESISDFSNVIGKSENEKLDRAEIVAGKEFEEIVNLLDLWTIYFRKLLIREYKKQNQIQITKSVLTRIKERIDLINKTKEDVLTKNINTRLAIENLFLCM